MKSTVILIAVMMFSAFGYAQVNHGLKGPAAKNYKFYMDDNKPAPTEIVASTKDPLQGPARKNAKLEKEVDLTQTNTVITTQERSVVVGPKAKSTKPGKYYQPTQKQQKEKPQTPDMDKEAVSINKP